MAISVILYLAMWLVWRTQKTYPGYLHWIVSILPNAAAFLLGDLRGMIPNWASVFLAHLLLCMSPILLYEGIRLFRGKPYRDISLFCLYGVLLAVLCYSNLAKPDFVVPLVCISLFTAYMLMRCAILLFFGVPPLLRPSYWFTASLFAMHALMLLLLEVAANSFIHQHYPLFSDSWKNLSFLANIILPVGWTFGFFMMTNARLTNELQAIEADLRELATTDPLTGALNRRSFIEMGEQANAQTRRTGAPVCILLFDLDWFKTVNDTYGHHIGDKLLHTVTHTCRAYLHADDLLARWGGEEFAILLPHIDLAGGMQVAAILCEAVSTIILPTEMGTVRTSISVGCAEWGPDTELDTIIHRADIALYHAKTCGRNRAIAYAISMESEVIGIGNVNSQGEY